MVYFGMRDHSTTHAEHLLLSENQFKFTKEKSDVNKSLKWDNKYWKRELGKEKKQNKDSEQTIDELNLKFVSITSDQDQLNGKTGKIDVLLLIPHFWTNLHSEMHPLKRSHPFPKNKLFVKSSSWPDENLTDEAEEAEEALNKHYDNQIKKFYFDACEEETSTTQVV